MMWLSWDPLTKVSTLTMKNSTLYVVDYKISVSVLEFD